MALAKDGELEDHHGLSRSKNQVTEVLPDRMLIE